MPKVFAIVVTYNGRRWYDKCLGSLRDSVIPVETIVVDNASSDDSIAYIKGNFPEVYLIESGENVGFAKANNIGIRYAIDHGADYVLLLNQDAWIEKDTLRTLLKTFEDNEKVGIASPVHLNGERSGVDYSFGKCLPSECFSDLYFNRDVAYYEVPFVNAACWLLSVDCVNVVGGFDTLLFQHFGEDNNFCQRVKYHGWRIIVNMHCSICHDREYRKDRIGKNPLWDNNNARIGLKVELGDITKSVDLNRRIRTLRIRKLLSLFSFRFSKVREYDMFLRDCLLIEESREVNVKPGLNWL